MRADPRAAASLYLLCFLSSLALLARSRRLGMRTRNVFLLLVCALMLLKWILTTFMFRHWPFWLLLFLNEDLPIFLSFVTYTLLIVQLVKMLLEYQKKAHLMRAVVYPTYFAVLALLIIAGITSSIVIGYDQDAPNNLLYDKENSLYVGITFLLLVTLVFVVGWRAYSILRTVAALSASNRTKNKVFLSLLGLYFVVFIFRGIWGVTYFWGVNPVMRAMKHEGSADPSTYHWVFVSFYIFVEILPAASTLAAFAVYLPVEPSAAAADAGRQRLLSATSQPVTSRKGRIQYGSPYGSNA